MTEEERIALIEALLEERAGVAARGQDDRVAAVDRELNRLGYGQAAASKRPRTSRKKETR